MESILKSQPGVCYICDRQGKTELHHIIFGTGFRKTSDEMGLTCYLCPEHHRGTYGVHGREGNEVNRYLKRKAQYTYELTHTRDEWMNRIGRNYLD